MGMPVAGVWPNSPVDWKYYCNRGHHYSLLYFSWHRASRLVRKTFTSFVADYSGTYGITGHLTDGGPSLRTDTILNPGPAAYSRWRGDESQGNTTPKESNALGMLTAIVTAKGGVLSNPLPAAFSGRGCTL